jgi:hypothetical protein
VRDERVLDCGEITIFADVCCVVDQNVQRPPRDFLRFFSSGLEGFYVYYIGFEDVDFAFQSVFGDSFVCHCFVAHEPYNGIRLVIGKMLNECVLKLVSVFGRRVL